MVVVVVVTTVVRVAGAKENWPSVALEAAVPALASRIPSRSRFLVCWKPVTREE